MVIKNLKPTTPSLRNLIRVKTRYSTKHPLIKSKIKGLKNNSGRNKKGSIVSYGKGGGHKNNYRVIDFRKDLDSENIVISIEYDPNRTADIAGILNLTTKSFSYVIAPKGLFVGDIVNFGSLSSLNLGHAMPLFNIPIGSFIHNISYTKKAKGSLSRSAGSYSRIISKTSTHCIIALKNGKRKLLPSIAIASLGIVSNEYKNLSTVAKAGRSRWLNRRPKVRGVAMNPVDHPHGGGEGKTSGGKTSVSPWGKPTKGGSTRNKSV